MAAWTPPASDKVKDTGWKPPASDMVREAAPAEEPGWFMPGSKSESFTRGLSQAATLGFGDEIQAALRTLGSDRTYAQVRDEERDANAAAQQANPGSYLAGGVAGSAGALGGIAKTGARFGLDAVGKTIGSTALNSARVGAVQGLGTSTAEDAAGMVEDIGKGAAIQGVTGGALKGAGQAITSVASKAGGNLIKAAAADSPHAAYLGRTVDKVIAGDPMKLSRVLKFEKLAGEATKDVGSPLAEGVKGAVEGIKGAYSGVGGAGGTVASVLAFGPHGLAAPAAYGAAKGVVKSLATKSAKNMVSGAAGGRGALTGTAPAQAVNATTLALQNMSGQDARKINTDVRAQIDEQAAAGRPVYAATFQALNQSPAYRVASEKVAAEPDAEDDEE